jgi:hypothetical protein
MEISLVAFHVRPVCGGPVRKPSGFENLGAEASKDRRTSIWCQLPWKLRNDPDLDAGLRPRLQLDHMRPEFPLSLLTGAEGSERRQAIFAR